MRSRMVDLTLLVVCVLLPLPGCRDRAATSSAADARAVPSASATNVQKDTAVNTPERTKLTYFGELTLADGAIAIMDGGTHGVQGHTVVIARDGSATWDRRLEGLRPAGRPGSGTFRPSTNELASVKQWSERLWERAAREPRSSYPPIEHGPPRWVWAIAIRRGSELRVLEGGALGRGDGTPSPEAKQLLDWLVERVDKLSESSAQP